MWQGVEIVVYYNMALWCVLCEIFGQPLATPHASSKRGINTYLVHTWYTF